MLFITAVSFTRNMDFSIEIGMSGEIHSFYVAQNGVILIFRQDYRKRKSLRNISYLTPRNCNSIDNCVDQLKNYANTDVDRAGILVMDASYYKIRYGNKQHVVAMTSKNRGELAPMSEIASILYKMID
jgi:hypothetical protein